MNGQPTLTAIIPTLGRATLSRCLRSLVEQPLLPGDECIVVGDTTDGPLPEVEALVTQFGPQFRYVAAPGEAHDFGHTQINVGMQQARGDYLMFNDDDDVYAPGAFGRIRRVIRELPEPRPLLFQFIAHWGMTYWTESCRLTDGRLVPRQDHIGGHCAVFPNIPERLGKWTPRYAGDYDFIHATLNLWPNRYADAIWIPEVIAIARPEVLEVTKRAGLVTSA